ncbi:MAG: hypothetical protein OEW69_08660 [Nitrospirota bacterium]|nr:hypothetical protein [Candidatus Aminicenantes bacterium]MDH5203313.1 hypothetical protein [Nitrospirota bacterium]MDH5743242.1 hypothetical protein [Candidatus Aminicenantes bacterium]
MKALFTICGGWGNCENKDLRKLFERKEEEGKIFEWPSEQQLEELNEICSSCEHPLELHEDDCPVCRGTALNTSPFPLPSKFYATSITQYFYMCMNCMRFLYSSRKIS